MTIKSTTEEFIEKAKKIHGDKYDYSKVKYINNHIKVEIKCKEHGIFFQRPNGHLRGSECIKCGLNKISNIKRSNREEFIEKAIKVHGNKYDYSKVNYINNCTIVEIICPYHGSFNQTPNSHLMGQNCRNCIFKNTNKYIERAIKVHGDRYDYSKLNYISAKQKIIIICKIHGEFHQTINNHLTGSNCPKCCTLNTANKKRNTNNIFIENSIKVHGTKYDYSKVNYINNKIKVKIICPNHGEFFQTPLAHIKGSNCNDCALIIISKKNRSNTEEFIEKAKKKHGNIYDYSKVNYIKYSEKVIIICKKHGEFSIFPYYHLHGIGCCFCVNKTEGMLFEKMKNHYPTIISQFKQEWCKNKRFDFCIPEYKIIIELDGRQHFEKVENWKSIENNFENDKFKEKCANENQYSTIRILQEDVYNNSYNWCEELRDAIEYVKECNKIQNIYLCKNGEYDNYYT